jgi:hypothetical protein
MRPENNRIKIDKSGRRKCLSSLSVDDWFIPVPDKRSALLSWRYGCIYARSYPGQVLHVKGFCLISSVMHMGCRQASMFPIAGQKVYMRYDGRNVSLTFIVLLETNCIELV